MKKETKKKPTRVCVREEAERKGGPRKIYWDWTMSRTSPLPPATRMFTQAHAYPHTHTRMCPHTPLHMFLLVAVTVSLDSWV